MNEPEIKIDRVEVLEYMQRHGGGFASKLATAWLHADGENSQRLWNVFDHMYLHYEERVRSARRTRLKNTEICEQHDADNRIEDLE